MPTTIAALQTKIDATSKTVQKLENYWYITLAIAAILGLGGAFLGNSLSDAKRQIDQLKIDVATASGDLVTKRAAALREISEAQTVAVASAASAVQNSIAATRQTTVESWLREERQLREARDSAQSRWIKFIYEQADAHGDTTRGANGWWQNALQKHKSLVTTQLP